MTSKTPLSGDLEKLVEFMKTDEKLKFLTQSYRQTGKKTFKADAPLFAPACYLEGGKGQENIRQLTHLSLVDFDELCPEVPPDIKAINALKQKLCDDPHTLLCYITMSGNGIRVIYPYEGDDYPAAFAKGNDYYQQLIGKKADFLCKNVNRLSGLAYDPYAYYKSCAKPFTAEEISLFHTMATKKNQQQKKQERINPQSPDYNVQLNYLQTLLALPWEVYTTDVLNIPNAEKVLNKDHYGLEKVKERILEHLAVLKLKGDLKSPIICLYGPPGVGKTSLGRSIAAALKRKYIRMSLGGVHDEAEIRGHRKTYIGAMPGRIIKSLIKAEASNPVIILDEIDKLSSDRQGDPASAMLEVLDPEQNNSFHDNYIDLDYDLSKVMFIATANNLGTIPTPLLDRMELIEVSGYITEEKIEIARRHLIPKEMEATGLKREHVKFTKPAIEYIIENYTRESGVRELEKKISKVMRKIALEIASDKFEGLHELKPADIRQYLGVPEYSRDKYQGNEYAGVVTGLAWTAVGGEILFVETSLSKGKGGRLTLTGNLGDVMKESAMLALEYLKAHTHLLDLPEGIFDNWNIHIHVPEGAIPKDGPSAGITMVTSLASALTQRKVKANLAMTGEITLRGKVLPVGGIREKILAAKRAGITDIILCEENRKDIEEIQPLYLKGLNFHYVKDIKEVLTLALTDEKVADAIDFTVTDEKKEEK